MAKINRFSGNVKAIASESQAGERYVFGSTSVTSDDLTDQMTNEILRGWATVGPSDFPPLEWFNAVAFTATQFNAYLHQIGVAEWDALQEYNADSIANYNGGLYKSLTDSNIGNNPTSSTEWGKVGFSDAVTDLDALASFKNGFEFFNFDQDAIGSPSGSYDAVGMQISESSQVTQIVSKGVENKDLLQIRVDDGGGFSEWKTIAIGRTESGFSNVADEDDTYITAESIITDTDVAIDLANITCLRIGDVAVVSGRVDLSGFSEPIPSDVSISFTYDLERRAIAEGWFTSITSTSYGAGAIAISGSGADNPHYGVRVSATTSGLSFFTGEIVTSHTSTNAETIEATFSIVVNVSD